jgi:hypothetical protein
VIGRQALGCRVGASFLDQTLSSPPLWHITRTHYFGCSSIYNLGSEIAYVSAQYELDHIPRIRQLAQYTTAVHGLEKFKPA